MENTGEIKIENERQDAEDVDERESLLPPWDLAVLRALRVSVVHFESNECGL